MAGITVLPTRLIRVAPAGGRTEPARPTAVIRPSTTTSTPFSMAGLPVPLMMRAPSNTTVPA